MVAAVKAFHARLPEELASDPVAAGLYVLASALDDVNSLTSKAMAQKELRESMDRLRQLMPVERKETHLDELNARRAKRQRRAASQ